VGDVITVGGVPLTAVGGPRVAATDTFSVDIRATATITPNAGLGVGDTIGIRFGNGVGDVRTLTAVVGPRAPGSLTFDVAAGAVAQAAAINTAINDSIISTPASTQVATSTVLGPVVTLTAGSRENNRGANGNSPVRNPGGALVVGLAIETSLATPADLTTTDFVGGVNADGGVTIVGGAVESNRRDDYAINIATAFNDAPGFAATVGQGAFLGSGVAQVQMTPAGAAGNGVVLTESTATVRLTVATPTAGGVDAVPATITAATSTVLPAGSAITLSVGSAGNRQELATDAFWGANSGSGLGIIVQMDAGGPAVLNVTYVNNRGYPEGV